MKTVYKFLALSVMMAGFVIANVAPSFAQEEEKTALYTQFTGCYRETDAAKRDACYAIAKQYLDKYEKDKDEYSDFVRKQYDRVMAIKGTEALYKRFNASIANSQAVNSDEAYASGREIIAQTPDLIDVPIILASIGFDNAVAKTPNDKFNADAINYARMAIQKIESGKTSERYGANVWSYKTDKYPDGRNNALGWMNYTIGYIMYYRQNQKKEALPFLYKATTFNSETKSMPFLYRTIGSWYIDEFIRMDKERVAKIETAGNVDTDETKAMLALQRGYADRAADAYARAYKFATDKADKDFLLNRTKEVYAIRFNKNMSGFDAFLAGVTNKPLVDPTTAVTPVVEATPATGATTGATTMTNTGSDTAGTAGTNRPANAGTANGVGSSTNGSGAATTKITPAKTTAKPAAKKPAPKKKG
jgi:hypothetical protein